MARTEQTTAQKARAVAKTAIWLATVVESMPGEPAPVLVRAIDEAHRALQVVSEANARNQICAMLLAAARSTASDQHGFVRGFIAATQNGDEFRVDSAPREASGPIIDAAIEAWARPPGRRGRGDSDKWTATAALLRESGFSYIEPAALRKAWDRRSK
jgi:hypothetical protein